MTAAFTYSNKENDVFPDHCKAAMIVWGELAKTIVDDGIIGTGHCRKDGSVHVGYPAFEITLRPDGSFSGKRIVNPSQHPQGLNEHSSAPAPEATEATAL